MKAGIALRFPVSVLGLIIILAIPSFAQNSSTATTTAPATSIKQASDFPETTTTTTGVTDNSGSSWERSTSDVAHNAEIATEKAYNDVARDVKDISLEGRVKAVLRENKSIRDSLVHVTADNGIVTLTGRVPSKQSAQRAQEVAASVYGVKAVNNDLNYPGSRGAVTPPDADSMGIAHPAYSDTAPAENAPAH